MLAALDLTTRIAVGIGGLAVAAWLAVQCLQIGLRWRGSVWHLPRERRGGRIVEAQVLAVLLALLFGLAAGGLGRALGVPFWPGSLIGIAVVLTASWRAASVFARVVALGEELLEGAPAEVPLAPLPMPAPAARGRRIVILCDGTGNRPPSADDPAATNIWKIGQALVDDEGQTVWYDPGVGTGTSGPARLAAALERWSGRFWLAPLASALGFAGRLRTAWEGLTGTGIGENILEGYSEIARRYRPGDRIYILGYSRGAYTARAIAGAIRCCGLLTPANLRHAPALMSLYRARIGHRAGGRSMATSVPVAAGFIHRDVPIEMLGVFDTVASLGAPLWGWWFVPRSVRNRALNANPMPNCRHVHHALAMDERRATFFPTLFWRAPGGWTETLEQAWFRGAHGDIGGGYAETGLSDITLDWMLERAERHGLVLRAGTRTALKPDPMARLHDETARRPSWNRLGTWPRWAKVFPDAATLGAGIVIHDSVLARAQRIRAETGRYDLHDLEIGETARITAEATCHWERTGLVLRGGRADPAAIYRLRWVEGTWRDAAGPARGPAGDAGGRARRRRLNDAPEMALCATLAGPQRWPLRELPLGVALAYLFRREPRLLLNQLAALGTSLRKPGDSLLIRSERPPALLYLFANGPWRDAGERAGALTLEVTRLDGDPGGAEPLWTLPAGGRWKWEDRSAAAVLRVPYNP
jgi:uncharacterized protein (DUF2235 family)